MKTGTTQKPIEGFLGGPVVMNPPANAGDTGSIPGPGRSHMLQGKLSLRAATTGAHAL